MRNRDQTHDDHKVAAEQPVRLRGEEARRFVLDAYFGSLLAEKPGPGVELGLSDDHTQITIKLKEPRQDRWGKPLPNFEQDEEK